MKAQRNSNLFGTFLKKGSGSDVVGRDRAQREPDVDEPDKLLGDDIVKVLKEHGPMSMMQLFDASGGDSITRLVQTVEQLEHYGILVCEKDDDDRPVSVALGK